MLSRSLHAVTCAGVLLFVREQTLMVQPFDDQPLSLSGDPTPIDRVTTVNNSPACQRFIL